MIEKCRTWLENLSAEDRLWLSAVFLAGMLGTMTSSFILRWGLAYYGQAGFLAQLLVCILATAVYAVTAGSVFYVLFPESREAFKRIFIRK